MREVLQNVVSETVFRINVVIAFIGGFSALALEQRARTYAALATGAWFTLQIFFLLRDRRKKARTEAQRKTQE